MKIIDMHCDTILECWEKGRSLRDGNGQLNLKLMKSHGALCQFFAIYLPRSGMFQWDPFTLYKKMYSVYKKELEKNSDLIRPALNARDIEKNAADGFMSSLLTIEDGTFISDKLDRIDSVYADGVRLITLLWGYPNTLGQPCYDDPADNSEGLTKLGFEAVERMNELGIIIDVSHISEGSFYDVSRHSRQPFMASHSCAKELCPHKRNLTDEQLKVIGNSDSIVGLNFYGAFLSPKGDDTRLDLILKHLDHMIQKAGTDHVGFGSDFDGIESAGELGDYSGYYKIISALQKKYSDDLIDKLLFKNALDFMKKVLK